MAMNDDLTTLVCLFHHQDQAQAALKDLAKAGIPQSSISVIDESGSNPTDFRGSSLAELGVPERDQQHLAEGVRNGGIIVAVSAIADHVDAVEDIFEDHSAKKIDEVEDTNPAYAAAPLAGVAAAGETTLPVIEEELLVGKRTVDTGGVRVYRRVVDIPVEETVSLREEHVVVERRPVDRAVTEADMAMQGSRTIELTETAEEAVVGKTARVVEEVLVGKNAVEHTETIHDTVRRTDVEVEQILPDTATSNTNIRRDL